MEATPTTNSTNDSSHVGHWRSVGDDAPGGFNLPDFVLNPAPWRVEAIGLLVYDESETCSVDGTTRIRVDVVPARMSGPWDVMSKPEPLLVDALPDFAKELFDALVGQGRSDLAQQIATLPIVRRCRCEELNCATFHTAPHRHGPFGGAHDCVEVEVAEGTVVLDTVADAIRCVEVLYRPDVRSLLLAVVP